jgi:hypothetical protein
MTLADTKACAHARLVCVCRRSSTWHDTTFLAPANRKRPSVRVIEGRGRAVMSWLGLGRWWTTLEWPWAWCMAGRTYSTAHPHACLSAAPDVPSAFSTQQQVRLASSVFHYPGRGRAGAARRIASIGLCLWLMSCLALFSSKKILQNFFRFFVTSNL